MDAARFARITSPVPYTPFAVGDIVEVAFYDRAYVVGHGLDQQVIGIKVRVDDQLAVIRKGDFEFVSASEAKAWRNAQKKQRSRARRGLD